MDASSSVQPNITLREGKAQIPGRRWGTRTVSCIDIKAPLTEGSDPILLTAIACHKKATGFLSTFKNWKLERKVRNHEYVKIQLEETPQPLYVKISDLTTKLGITKEELSKETNPTKGLENKQLITQKAASLQGVLIK